MVAAEVDKTVEFSEKGSSNSPDASNRLYAEVGWSKKNDSTSAVVSDGTKTNPNDAIALGKPEGGDGTLTAGQAADAAKKDAGGDAAKKDLLDLSKSDPLDSGLRHVNGAASKLAENAAKNAKNAPDQVSPEHVSPKQVGDARSGSRSSAATIETSKMASDPVFAPAVVNKRLGAQGKDPRNAPGADRSGTRQSSYDNGKNPSYFSKDDNSHLPVRNDSAAAKMNKRISDQSGNHERTGKPESHPGKKTDARDKVDHSHNAKDAHKPAKHEAIKKSSPGRTRGLDETGSELNFPKIDGYDATGDNTKTASGDMNKSAVAGDNNNIMTNDKAAALDMGKPPVAGDSTNITTGDFKASEKGNKAEQIEAAPNKGKSDAADRAKEGRIADLLPKLQIA